MKNMSSGIIFSDIFGFVGHFFVSFCVSGTSFDVFGVLGTSGAQNKVTTTCPCLVKVVLNDCMDMSYFPHSKVNGYFEEQR